MGSTLPFARAAALVAALMLLAATPALAHDDLDSEIAAASKRLAGKPPAAEDLLVRAELYRLEQEWQSADRDLDAAERLDPRLQGLDLARAALALDRGRLLEARLRVERILERRPTDPQALELAARVSKADGRPLLAPAPGDDATVTIAGARAPLTTLVTISLITQLSVWKFDTPVVDPGATWQGIAFDDAAWPSGPGVLGFGEAYIATPVPMGPTPTERWPTTNFRRVFSFAGDVTQVTALTLTANYDDGFVAYLNGVEIARRALPGGPINRTTPAAQHEGGVYETIDVTPFISALQPGANVLAVEVHQSTLTSSDLVWDASLIASEDEAQVVRGPYLQIGTATGIIVRWRTNVPATSAVRYGLHGGALDRR